MKRLADARHRTPHWLMREAIGQYVEREEKRESYRQDAISAWNEYQATGKHVTLDGDRLMRLRGLRHEAVQIGAGVAGSHGRHEDSPEQTYGTNSRM